jgi:hypothetical protein
LLKATVRSSASGLSRFSRNRHLPTFVLHVNLAAVHDEKIQNGLKTPGRRSMQRSVAVLVDCIHVSPKVEHRADRFKGVTLVSF